MGPICSGPSALSEVTPLSSLLDRTSGLLCLARLVGLVLTASAANAADLYKLEDVIDKPLKAAIEEFPGGAITYSTRPNRPLYEVRGWRGLSFLLFETGPAGDGSMIQEQFRVTSARLEFSDSVRVTPAQAAEFLKQNLGVDVTTGRERYDANQNILEYTGVGMRNWAVYFEAFQIPIHLKHGGVELRPDHAEPIKKRVADIMIR
jgi:hypothetical protein